MNPNKMINIYCNKQKNKISFRKKIAIDTKDKFHLPESLRKESKEGRRKKKKK